MYFNYNSDSRQMCPTLCGQPCMQTDGQTRYCARHVSYFVALSAKTHSDRTTEWRKLPNDNFVLFNFSLVLLGIEH
jgi:hypothetical protein